jgi:hypothetical protein
LKTIFDRNELKAFELIIEALKDRAQVVMLSSPTGYVYYSEKSGMTSEPEVSSTHKAIVACETIVLGKKLRVGTFEDFVNETLLGMYSIIDNVPNPAIVFMSNGFNKSTIYTDDTNDVATGLLYTARVAITSIDSMTKTIVPIKMKPRWRHLRNESVVCYPPEEKVALMKNETSSYEPNIPGGSSVKGAIESTISTYRLQDKNGNWFKIVTLNGFPTSVEYDSEESMALMPTEALFKKEERISYLEDRIRLHKDAIEDLEDMYIANRETSHEFIKCITPKSASEMSFFERTKDKYWTVWDRARVLLRDDD